jgi:hypothetical protein
LDLLREARTIHGSRELAVTKFQHLCLTLETAAFAVLDGWTVSYEEASTSGRRPDLTLRRRGISYALEVTVLGLDRGFRASDRFSDVLMSRLRGLEREHGVEISCRATEILSDEELGAWPDEVAHACQLTATDEAVRSVGYRNSRVEVFPDGQRPPGQVLSGPMILGDVWRRVGVRIAEKARQTASDAAWLRIDDTGALLRLTDRSAQPLQGLLADLQRNVRIALAGARHVRGVILTGGVMLDPANSRDQTAWEEDSPSLLITPGPERRALADGPAALARKLPGGRWRLTFILPGPHSQLMLPSGTGLEPGMWYHHEASWLTRALQALGHPQLDSIISS